MSNPTPAEATSLGLKLLWQAVIEQLVDRDSTREMLREVRILLGVPNTFRKSGEAA
jgi:hypothetical protein